MGVMVVEREREKIRAMDDAIEAQSLEIFRQWLRVVLSFY